MKKRRLQSGVALLISIAAALYAISPSQAMRGKASDIADHQAMIEDYCVGCHNKVAKTAGISLEGLDFNKVGADAGIWERVLRKVRFGQMPPPGKPHPDAAAVSSFVSWLETSLDRAAEANPNPGRPAPHRLNRAEYSDAIRDLLAVDIDPGSALPVDDSGYGFDNIGDVLTLSPALLEKYMSSARRISRLAVGDTTIKPGEDEYQPRREPPGTVMRSKGERVSDDLPFYSRGGLSFKHYFPLDAEYLVRIRSNRSFYDMQVSVKAGLHTVGVTFPRSDAKPEPAVPSPVAFGQPPKPAGQKVAMDLRLDGARVKRFDVPDTTNIDVVLLRGPFKPTGRGETASREKIFVCRPASEKEEAPCARKILESLTRRAFRRPVTDADINPLLAFYERGRSAGDFDYGIQCAIEAMLVSPDFLFRIEHDPREAAGSVYHLNDFDLASRLSFFLWSSIPDDQLLNLAEQGKLSDPAVLQQQVNRMLDDPRSQAFISNFGGQWLTLRNLELVRPDPESFPTFDEGLRQAFRRETELFFESILRENRSIFDLIDANYTFLNQRLAEHYDIKGIYGSQFRRVTLNDPNRGGLLGQGSILTVTSYPNRTSIVLRGKWVLENLLGAPPPPPPPDIPDLKPHGKDGRQLTMREQMEAHRINPVCASCHARMDPIGFSLENYDGTGKWRSKDAGVAIDASGKMPDGTKFSGPQGLKKLLLAGHRDEFATTVTEKLLTYALGRGLEAYDKPSVRAIMKEAAQDDYRLPALITAIIKSRPFQMRSSAARLAMH